METIKIFSWNILGPMTRDVLGFSDRYSEIGYWPERCERIVQKIVENNPDLVCLQEVDNQIKFEFVDLLEWHDFGFGSYETKGMHGGVVVFYKKSKFDLMQQGRLHLNVGDVKYHSGACALVALQDKKTLQHVLISSVHFQPQNIKEQCLQLFDYLASMVHKSSVIIMGDFNTRYQVMQESLMYMLKHEPVLHHDMNMFLHHSWTHQSLFQHDGKAGWSSIDHCLYSQDVLTVNVEQSFVGNTLHSYRSALVAHAVENTVDHTMPPIPCQANVSDHLPLVVVFDWK